MQSPKWPLRFTGWFSLLQVCVYPTRIYSSAWTRILTRVDLWRISNMFWPSRRAIARTVLMTGTVKVFKPSFQAMIPCPFYSPVKNIYHLSGYCIASNHLVKLDLYSLGKGGCTMWKGLYLEIQSRNMLHLFPPSPDDYDEPNNPVRAIDANVGNIKKELLNV